MKPITTILSSGYGRLHLAQSAQWLNKTGVIVKLVCGWVPRNPNGRMVRLCSWLMGRDLSSGMRKRAVALERGGEVLSCAWADFLSQMLFMLERVVLKGRFHGSIAAFAWWIFGWQTQRDIKKFGVKGRSVFHVRSGAGHGGAIKLAQRMGIPVVVDHSIAHPAFMETNLRNEYERNQALFDLGVDSRFWRMVAEDCNWADVLLVNSYFVRDTFVEQGYPSHKIKVVYLGTRHDFSHVRRVRAVGRGDRKLKLLFTGGFGFRKGAEYILDAVKLLKKKASVPFEMDVVGDFSGAKSIIEKHKDENLPVTFHGPVPQEDLKRFLAQSDIYVFPSLAEGCACS
ncbi:MAG: glycosyltransferase family 4 protein, partial [Kiritimatiellae bacterium]|nr:glycosyltransferase family 4 protein [Kiritimatiellia bacterium]